MRCPGCQQENPAGSNFCLGCGARLVLACAGCGADLPAGARFCNKCGAPVAAGSAGPARFASPGAYTPRHLAERILTSKSALEGERKQVTVLFADLKGSMELLADRDPEEARKLLDPVLERMMEAVHRYEGTVNQVMGDGIMALFGAPLAHEDHAVRACYAALRLQEAIKTYSDEARQRAGVSIAVRVGLNSGEVVVRSIGSDLRMDYTAVGQTTHLAARMEQAALPGSIVMTADTLRLAEGYVQVKPLGPMSVKGLSEPVEAYEVTGTGPVRNRLQAAAARGLTRFVARDAEMEALRRARGLASEGRGQVVAVVGEPGVGKSRLFYEFTRSQRARDWVIVETGAVSYGKGTAYLPVVELLRAYFELAAHDDARRIREKVTGKTLTLDDSLKPTLPALLALLDVPLDDASWRSLDPPQRRQRTLDAVKRLLLRESQRQPLLLVFEDLHWIDSETQAQLDGLVESLPTARLLLVVNYRPEYDHAWGKKTYYTQLRVDPLPPESTEVLLAALLGEDPGLASLKRLLLERTEGNPFFLEESVQTLSEAKALVGERGAYRLARPVEEIQVPATVQAVLAARIDRLPGEEKSLLQVAAVIGETVPLGLLHAVADQPEESLRPALAHLQATEFLYEASLFPDLEYSFKHGLTYQVAYNSLLHERRCALHASAVEAIERLWRERSTEHLERLAHHALRGEVWEKALVYLRLAGAKALARSANREAAVLFEQALSVLGHIPENRTMLEQAIDLRFELRQALQPIGEDRRVLDFLGEAETLATTLGDQRRLAWVSAYLSQYHFWMGEADRGLTAGQRALGIGKQLEDFGLQVLANSFLGLGSFISGDFPRAIVHGRKNVEVLSGDLVRERFGLTGLASVNSLNTLGRCLVQVGEFREAHACGDESIRIAESVAQPYSLVSAYTGVGYLHLAKGDVAQALPLLERALLLLETSRPFFFPPVASSLGIAYVRSGRIAEGVSLLERVVEAQHGTLQRTGGSGQAAVLILLGEAYLRSGRTADALQAAQHGLRLARERHERGTEADGLRLLGEIASHGDAQDLAEAETSYLKALTLARELGMRPLVAHCELGLGRMDHRTGKRQQAQEHLTAAATMYREMDMRSWLAQAEAELKESR